MDLLEGEFRRRRVTATDLWMVDQRSKLSGKGRSRWTYDRFLFRADHPHFLTSSFQLPHPLRCRKLARREVHVSAGKDREGALRREKDEHDTQRQVAKTYVEDGETGGLARTGRSDELGRRLSDESSQLRSRKDGRADVPHRRPIRRREPVQRRNSPRSRTLRVANVLRWGKRRKRRERRL